MQTAAAYIAPRLANVSIAAAHPAGGSNGTPSIGTHDGSFHCDEAMACGLLRHTEAYKNAYIVRTRNPAELEPCSIVVDVGAVYDVSKNRYDHHQNSFQDKMTTNLKSYNTRLSSAGLVYKHFGLEILREYSTAQITAGKVPGMSGVQPCLTDYQLNMLYDRVYHDFIEHVDGIDNGVEEFGLVSKTEGGEIPADLPVKMDRNYSVTSTLGRRIARLYPRWNVQSDNLRAEEDKGFAAAMELATMEFFENVDYNLCSWLPARSEVEAAFKKNKEIHDSCQIMVLASGGCPWKDHLVEVEKQNKVQGRTLYVLFPDTKGNWRIQAVPKEGTTFGQRKSLPWKGLRDAELSEASGIAGGIFVHAAGFIGGNVTYDGALQMAIKALSME